MHPVPLAVALLLLGRSPAPPPAAAPATGTVPSTAPGAGATPSSAPSPGSPLPPSASFPIEYRPPENPDHQRLHDAARAQRVLEKLSRFLGFLRLPQPLTLRLAGCQGEANAWYDDADRSATFCYEMLAEFVRNAPEAQAAGLELHEAVLGPFFFFYLHEIGHAVFDLLRVPVLGREEDAADQFATIVLLAAGEDVAASTLRGAAWTFRRDARSRAASESDFADVHGLDAQRYYNVLCLAVGGELKAASAAERWGLPKDRAEGCDAEYRQVRHAVTALLGKYADPEAFRLLREEAGVGARTRRRAPGPAAPSPPPAPPPPPPPADVPRPPGPAGPTSSPGGGQPPPPAPAA
jgi:hypothetical protein